MATSDGKLQRGILYHYHLLPMLKDGVTCRQYNLNVLHGVGRTTSLICEKSEMLEIFLGSVNNRLWFHLGFSRRNASIFSRQSLFYGFTG